MTRLNALPLDGDALDQLQGAMRLPGSVDKFGGLKDGELVLAGLIAQSRAALALEAERDALKAQVERLREEATRALDAIAWANSMAAYDALKRALAERAPEVER